MPNWCNNNVTFKGSPSALDKVDALFSKMMLSTEGVRPEWLACERYNAPYLFDIQGWDKGDYQFLSKWSPALSTIMLIGRRFKVEYEHRFDESGMGLYGKAVFNPIRPASIKMYDGSCINFRYNEDTGMYVFNGEEYESEYDFIESAVDELEPHILNKPQIFQSW